ncbi:EamA family transporter [Micromonospora sp. PPF5-17]|uniref:EamA family transporter n=1 Tax=Micromonospora solifontis TaxID=2487138 RepID=A0ABX9WIK9_9ACTN|nr:MULTISPECIES: EamA family transporter [Micromonospora]NES37400.1 EamA family transporter [Micromonospora solifontis]NES58055.1 EamA family transporter [Micromonospora sp. PPF5-6]RNL98408.1 EamA family transporter [Micromonospora solifontis]
MKASHRLLAVLVAAIWGVNFVAIELGLRDLPPLVLTALRFVAAAVPLVFLVPRPSARLRYVVTYGLVLGVLKFGALFTALAAGMSAGLASLVLQAQALMSVLLAAAVLGERPARAQVAGVLVGSAGIGVLAVGSGGHATVIGFLLTLFAAASWAVANLVMRASGEQRPLSLLVWSSLVPPLPLLGLAGVIDGGEAVLDAITGLSWRGLLAVAYVAYVSTLVGFGIWNRLIARYSIARVAPFSLLVPVFGLSAAWLLLDEPVGPTELVAGAIVLAGLALVVRRSTPDRDDATTAGEGGEPEHARPVAA